MKDGTAGRIIHLFLLLALGMRLIAVLVGSLRVLSCRGGMLLALGVIAFAVMFGGGTMCFRCILVVLCSLVVLVFGHVRCLSAPS
jgi:hypothetical protein